LIACHRRDMSSLCIQSVLLAAGIQDSSNWGVPDSGVLHDQGQEELPAPQPACYGFCLPLQAGQHPALISVGTHASFAVQTAVYCGLCWATMMYFIMDRALLILHHSFSLCSCLRLKMFIWQLSLYLLLAFCCVLLMNSYPACCISVQSACQL